MNPQQVLQLISGRIPFLGGTLSLPQRDGPGVRVSVVVAATGTDVSITHALGYIPTIYWIIDSGTTYTPGIKRGVASWNSSTMALQFNATGTFTLFIR